MPTLDLPRIAIFAAGLVCVTFHAAGQSPQMQKVTFEVGTVSQADVSQRLRRLRSKDSEREAELKAMFAEEGCTGEQMAEEVVQRKDPPNIICTLPGTTQSRIIVGAHFDHAPEGDGAVDDWSGASLLPSIYEALKAGPRKHTIELIGFTLEERGLLGSALHVKHLTAEQRDSIRAVVNLECLGLASTEVWVHAADPRLLDLLDRLAWSVKIPLKRVDVQAVGNDDTQAFRDKKIPSITLHSLTQESLLVIHSRRDKLAAVNAEKLYESFRLAAQYVAYLDQVLE